MPRLAKRDIHGLIERNEPITKELANEIYDRYFGVVSESETIRETGQSLGQITLSAGVSLYHGGEPEADFLQRADEALYAAKRSGRNRVIFESQPGAFEAA